MSIAEMAFLSFMGLNLLALIVLTVIQSIPRKYDPNEPDTHTSADCGICPKHPGRVIWW